MKKKIILIKLVLLLTSILASCAGPRLASHPGGKYEVNKKFSTANAPVYIQPFTINCDVDQKQSKIGMEFSNLIAKKLTKNKKFSSVGIIQKNEKHDGLILKGKFEAVDKAKWGTRIMLGSQSLVRVQGTVYEGESGDTILTFEKSRSGCGGIFGAGGILAAGDNAMIKKLTIWLSDDIISIIEGINKNN